MLENFCKTSNPNVTEGEINQFVGGKILMESLETFLRLKSGALMVILPTNMTAESKRIEPLLKCTY